MTGAHGRKAEIGLGIAYRLGAVLAMGATNALVKLCAEHGAPTMQIIFFRNAVGLIPILIFIACTTGFGALRTRRPGGHVARAIIGIAGMICGITALGMIPLAEYTAINFASPLIITALSVPILKEPVGPRRWAAVVVGLIGVMIVLQPDPAHMAVLGSVLALGQAMGNAGAMIAIRQLGSTETGPAIAFYFSVASAAVGALALPFVWVTPDATTLLLLVGSGVAGGLMQLGLSLAFSHAPAAILAPLDYLTLIWSGVLGYLIWQDFPRTQTWIGATLVVASGLYMIFHETRRRPMVRARG